MIRSSQVVFLIAVLLATARANAAAQASDGIAIVPGDFTLSGPAARQTLLIQRVRDGKYYGEVSDGLDLASSNSAVVKIEPDHTAVPVGNGEATLTAKSGSLTSGIKVTVAGMDKPFQWSFRNHVQPVLAKFGCSSGACHGAAAGQNGFKLSLRGYDDAGDWKALTRNALGRRIVPQDPSASLLVQKPTGVVPHKGGVRFAPDSQEFRVLSEWIADGAPPPKENEERVVRIEVLPRQVILKPGVKQRMVVRAYFSDGSTQDVTRWAKYTAADTSVATVDDKTGEVSVVGPGEGAITAWYLSKIAIATVTSPYANDVPVDTFAKAQRRNFIDDLVLEKLQSLNLPPSPRAADPEFIRRAFLDTVGVLPTPEETKAFLADSSPDKRDKLIESLLARPEFVDYWAYKWSDLLLVSSKNLKAPAMWSYYNWVRNQVALNTPWDRFAREVLTARGSTSENGAAAFYVLHDDPRLMSETATLTFMGTSINCAKCHNHPMEKWTNDQYYAMANLFSRVRSKNGSGDGEMIVFAAADGELVQPLTGKPQAPKPLEGDAVPTASTADRREALADWLCSPKNPYFARSIANRVWANFMGVGLVEAVDDMRETNPPSNEKLMAALADHLVQNKFDLKSLMRLVLQSETYQRSSTALPGNAKDARFYSRYYPRRMMAEVMLDAFSQVTGAPTQFKDYPLGWRALQLPDSNVDSYFLESFGRAERKLTCECERTEEPSMAQVLHIANGDTVNQKLKQARNEIEKLIAEKAPDERIVEEAYLSALCRMPTEAEKKSILVMLSGVDVKQRREVVEDVYWSILSSREFLFNR
jgi:hypothetical protein